MNDNMVMITERRFGELIEAENMSAAYECDLKNSIEISERLEKERDELKAKLESTGGKIDFNVAQETVNHLRDRLAAAERCIDEIASRIDCKEAEAFCGDIIRAYREKKGGAK